MPALNVPVALTGDPVPFSTAPLIETRATAAPLCAWKPLPLTVTNCCGLAAVGDALIAGGPATALGCSGSELPLTGITTERATNGTVVKSNQRFIACTPYRFRSRTLPSSLTDHYTAGLRNLQTLHLVWSGYHEGREAP